MADSEKMMFSDEERELVKEVLTRVWLSGEMMGDGEDFEGEKTAFMLPLSRQQEEMSDFARQQRDMLALSRRQKDMLATIINKI